VKLAGGSQSHIVLIPTASLGNDMPSEMLPEVMVFLERRMKERFGVTTVSVLHTHDRARSDSESFVAPLRRATGVWMLGGFPERLVQSFLGTRTQRAMRDLLDRGGVVGGESAGAMIQGSWLDSTDDGFTPEIRSLMQRHAIGGGFGFLAETAVFPHFDARGPDAAIRQSAAHRNQVSIGIDNEAALVVRGDVVEVVGVGAVSLYNVKGGSPANPVVLRSGDRYDLRSGRR
jgi:cyanophycinase